MRVTAAVFWLRRCLTVAHFVGEQPYPILVTEVYARELKGRLVPALFERACVVVQRNERQKLLGEMFLHTDVRTQETIETFHCARRPHDLL
jgi:hypothetical protein